MYFRKGPSEKVYLIWGFLALQSLKTPGVDFILLTVVPALRGCDQQMSVCPLPHPSLSLCACDDTVFP